MRLFDDVASRVEDPSLRRALSLALRGRGTTWPNPLVGCVIVRDGQVLGEGYHPQAGRPHAEIFALAHAGDRATGATAFVTLEPCAHHGKTPPCADALIAAGVTHVVIGMHDPNPLARGGAHVLREAGVEVRFASDPSPFAEINAGWLKRLATGRPRVTVKLALSIDAHGALSERERASITGASGASVTRRLREAVDAVVVGASTVEVDDPSLTVRDDSGVAAPHQPMRIVLARSSAPRSDATVFRDQAAPTMLLAADTLVGRLPALPAHVTIEHYAAEEGLAGALDVLGARGLNDVLVEPGPRLFTSLWDGGHIDELFTVVAGGVAGALAPPVYAGAASASSNALSHDMKPVEAGIVGDVAVTLWRPQSCPDGLWTP